MDKIIFNGVDIFNPLEGKMDKIVEYFVLFYGEKYRQRIEEKLKDTTYIFMPKLDSRNWKKQYNRIMQDFTEEKVDSMFRGLEKKMGVRLFYETNRRFDIDEIIEAKEKFLAGEKLTYQQKYIIQSFSQGVQNWLYEKEKSREKVACNINEFLTVYQKDVKPKIDTLLKERLNVIVALKEMLPNVKAIRDNAETETSEAIANCFYKIVAKRQINASVSVMSKYVTIFAELFMQKQLPLITTAKQKLDYVGLFKFLGINYGDEYWNYYKNKNEIEALIFDKELEAKLSQINCELEESLTTKNELYANAIKIIDGLNIKYPKNKEDILEALYDFVYSQGTEAFTISYIEAGTDKLKQLCICRDYVAVATDTVVHEMNHLIEENLIYETDEIFCTKSGFDILPFAKYVDGENLDLSVYYKDELTRTYEMINEIINEFITNCVFEKMEEDEFSLGLGENYCSYYRDAFPVFGKLICDNKDKFIEARLSERSAEITKYISKADFDKLVQIAGEILEDENFMDSVLDEIDRMGIDSENFDSFATISELKGADNLSLQVQKIVETMYIINGINEKMQSGKILKMWEPSDTCTK